MPVRGIRGAITVDEDMPVQVLEATQKLLQSMQEANRFEIDDIASVLFTVTPDICSVFPAQAARLIGWDRVPLLCFQEIKVPGALPHCIRVLLHINTNNSQQEIKHIYLRGAKALREDLSR